MATPTPRYSMAKVGNKGKLVRKFDCGKRQQQ